MQDNQSYTVDDILFKARREENIIVLNIKNNLLQKATDLSAKELLFEYLRRVSDDDGIKVILIIGAHDKTGREEYLRFYRNILTTKINPENLERLYNAVNQFIKRIVCIDKMVVHAVVRSVYRDNASVGIAVGVLSKELYSIGEEGILQFGQAER